MTQDCNEQVDDAFWAALAAAVLHPVEVEIIEALRYICRPLTPTDLLLILEGRHAGLRIERRLRRLRKLGAIACEDNGKARGRTREPAYRLVVPARRSSHA